MYRHRHIATCSSMPCGHMNGLIYSDISYPDWRRLHCLIVLSQRWLDLQIRNELCINWWVGLTKSTPVLSNCAVFTVRLTCSKSCARATQPFSWKTARLVVQGLHLHPRSDAHGVESMSGSRAWLRCGPTLTTITHMIQGTTSASQPAGGT